MAAWPAAHWVFVSTVNVYRDNETPDPGTDGPLVEAIEEDRDLGEDPEAYGGMKVACERLVLDGAARSMVVRPGLIVGPGDPSGRTRTGPSGWPSRGPVLGPGRPTTGSRSSTPATSPSGSCAASSPGRPVSSTASAR